MARLAYANLSVSCTQLSLIYRNHLTMCQHDDDTFNSAAQKKRRAESNRRRGGGGGLSAKQQDKLFTLGLADSCPRCGDPMSEFPSGEEQRQHLRECDGSSDKAKAHKAAKAKAAGKEHAREAAEQAQLEAESAATWRLLGSKTETLWMLTDGAIAKECKSAGVDVPAGASKDAMIAALAKARPPTDDGTLRLMGVAQKPESAAKRRRMTAESLPSNLHSMELGQLKSVLAAHGITDVGESKAEILSYLEDGLYKEKESAPLRITGGSGSSEKSKRATKKTKKKATSTAAAWGSDSDGSNSDSAGWMPSDDDDDHPRKKSKGKKVRA